MTFNINAAAVTDSARLHLEDAVGDKMYADEAKTLPLEIELKGKASKEYRAALAKLSRKDVLRKGKKQSFDVNVDDNAELLASISARAFNFTQDGEAIDNLAAFKKLYLTPGLYFIRDQVQAELDNAEAFLQR